MRRAPRCSYPPSGLIPGQGTVPPDDWSTEELLGPIIASLPDGA